MNCVSPLPVLGPDSGFAAQPRRPQGFLKKVRGELFRWGHIGGIERIQIRRRRHPLSPDNETACRSGQSHCHRLSSTDSELIVTARRHHYVPQCYLRGFVLDRDKPQLFVIDGKDQRTFCTAPANVAAERDFHRIEVDDYPPDALENAFSGFETEVSQALHRIITTRSIKNDDARAYLLNLMALMAIKNPRHREGWRTAQEQLWKRVLDLATATPERWASQIRLAKAAGDIDADADEDYQRMREFVEVDQYRINVPTGRHLEMEMKAFETVLPFFFHRRWVLFRAPVGTAGFVTSDHPVCLMWSDPEQRGKFHPPGHGLRRTQILFPISNELAVMGAFESHDEERDAPDWLIAQFNATVALHADRQIYARDSNFMYRMAHNERIMRGDEFLADQESLRLVDS
jgi:hypothetical protein